MTLAQPLCSHFAGICIAANQTRELEKEKEKEKEKAKEKERERERYVHRECRNAGGTQLVR